MALDYKVVGNRIQTIRREKGLTQKDLAEDLNVTIAFISRVERGSAHVNLTRLVEISEILDVPLSCLITGSVESSNNYLNDDFTEVLKECGPDKQRLILDVAKLVAKL